MMPDTIENKLQIGNNSFGALRLIAASAVVFSHSWSVTGGITAPEPLEFETGFSMGWHAVNLFFALSGLLIAGSLAHTNSILQFAWSRILRVFPALIVVAVVTVSVAAATVDTSMWESNSVLQFLARNIFLAGGGATLPGVFVSNPSPSEINIPLWTLKYEIAAYFSIALVSSFCLYFASRKVTTYVILSIVLASAIAMAFFGDPDSYGRLEHSVRLIFAFYLGVAAWHWRGSIQAQFNMVLLLLMVVVALSWMDLTYHPMQILFLAYAGLYFGIKSYGWFSRFTDKQDYSYGVYIIGYPIQQVVVAYTGILNPWVNFAISMPLILMLAMVSWNLIEKPSLKLKKLNMQGAFERWRSETHPV